MTDGDLQAAAARLRSPDEMSISERADIALRMVEGWQGDPRGALNCFYSQALAEEVRRLRAALSRPVSNCSRRPAGQC